MSPSVSVIIPHYNDPAGLDACLAALARQTVEPREIIVADNASPQGEAEVARVIAGRARLVIVNERGAGPARNGGVAASTGDILAFTDSDCLPDSCWLEEAVSALADVDLVGGAMKVLVADEARLTPEEAFERVFAFDNRSYVEQKGFTVTANLFCRRAVFDKVGGFHVGVPEDLEWCHRARDAGYRISYAPRAVVGHLARSTWPELVRKGERLNREAFTLAVGRPMGRAKWFIKALAMPLSAFVHSTRPMTSRNLTRTRDRFAALLLLHRQRSWRALHSLRLLVEQADPARHNAGSTQIQPERRS